ncbi:MAG: hypothetical protein AB7F86_05995 [Bdellovibrionales bacterium]
MAVFQHHDHSIAYSLHHAPFNFDLVLLQGSQFTSDFWKPVLSDLTGQTAAAGRLLICDWYDAKVEDENLAENFIRLVGTIGLNSVRVVAFDDAVEMVAEAQRQHPGLFDKTLFFPQGGPKGDDLTRAVRDLCQI